ncbi:MAG: dTMP kinase [Pseudomonadota bacterium]
MKAGGRFITLEGGEGTGKSTLIAGLSEALKERGHQVIVTREPGGTPLAEDVRSLALNPPAGESWSPLSHALLMNTARDDHLNKLIRPALERGDWVLCDRFADSTRAYQRVDGQDIGTLLKIEQAVVRDTRPDLTLILDGAPEDLAERRRERGVKDVFEQKDLEFHSSIRAAFLEIAGDEPERCVVIDALQSPANVLEEALNEIDARLGRP